MRRYQIDALVFSGYKWATAGYGIAGLYVKRELLVSSPFAIVGWRSARVPYDMIYDRLDLTDEARALEAGHPLFPGIFALGASLSLIRKIGVHRIAKRISELTDVLHRHLKAAGYTISSPQQPDHRSSITLIGMKDAKGVAERLLERGVFVSFFENSLRVSLHFYNNEDDIDALLTHLRDFEELI